MSRRTLASTLGLLVAVLTAVPSVACTVCMGDPEAPITRGLVFGIFVLLGFILSVLGGFGYFFITLARRARLAAQAPTAPAT